MIHTLGRIKCQELYSRGTTVQSYYHTYERVFVSTGQITSAYTNNKGGDVRD